MSINFDRKGALWKAIWKAAGFAVAEGKSRLEFVASMVVEHGPDAAQQARHAYEAQRDNQAVRRSDKTPRQSGAKL
jgi:hypothetical protein